MTLLMKNDVAYGGIHVPENLPVGYESFKELRLVDTFVLPSNKSAPQKILRVLVNIETRDLEKADMQRSSAFYLDKQNLQHRFIRGIVHYQIEYTGYPPDAALHGIHFQRPFFTHLAFGPETQLGIHSPFAYVEDMWVEVIEKKVFRLELELTLYVQDSA